MQARFHPGVGSKDTFRNQELYMHILRSKICLLILFKNIYTFFSLKFYLGVYLNGKT